MKKVFILIATIVIIVVTAVFVRYTEYTKTKTEIQNINKEFLGYEKSIVQINKVVTLMNRAIELNRQNKIKQNDDLTFIENDTNTIRIYLETTSSKDKTQLVKIPMEDLILNSKSSIETVEYAFSDLLFEMTDVQYHSKSGQVKQIVFTEKIQ